MIFCTNRILAQVTKQTQKTKLYFGFGWENTEQYLVIYAILGLWSFGL